MKNILLSCLVISLLGCSSEPSEPAPQIMGKKFSSMSECLESIKNTTGQPLKPMTDKPTEVTGFLGETGLQFYCGLKETGTEGTYIDGWYQEAVKK